MNESCGNQSCIEAGVDQHRASGGKCQSSGKTVLLPDDGGPHLRIQQVCAEDPELEVAMAEFTSLVQKPVKWRVRPFGSWRWNEIGIGFSLSFDQLEWSGLWIPDIWLHVGPLVVGLEVVFS